MWTVGPQQTTRSPPVGPGPDSGLTSSVRRRHVARRPLVLLSSCPPVLRSSSPLVPLSPCPPVLWFPEFSTVLTEYNKLGHVPQTSP